MFEDNGGACFIVKDAHGQSLAYIYFKQVEPGQP
jgi:hypothetical protein